jgi:leader peptidase (prepilin peptidase)/N-methyltransferase
MMNVPWPIVAAIALFGLAIGSFLNVVIYRVPRQESIVSPGSHCPFCDNAIKGRHNVPVFGWLLLRGRCASCRARISARYPLVELGTGVLFAAITLRFGLAPLLPAYLYLAAIGVALAAIEFDVRRLPDTLVLPSYVISVLLLMPAGAAQSDWWRAERALLGMGALLVVYFALCVAYPNGLTMGDVKLAGLVGLYLGWLSWGALLIGAFGGFLIAGVGGTAVVASKHSRGPAVPLAPCLVSSTVLALFVTVPLTHWYTALLPV